MTASSDVSQKVLQYKLQLSESTESKTVLRILKILQEFDITPDILAETGIGKAVNALRKHGDAGEVAKSLVRNWKKLVPNHPSSHAAEGPASQSECLKQKHSAEYLKTEDQSQKALKKDENPDVSKGDPWNSEDKHQEGKNEDVKCEGKISKSTHKKSRSTKESKNNLDTGGKCGAKRDSRRTFLESPSKSAVEVPSKSEVVSKRTLFDLAKDQGDKKSAKVSNDSLTCDGKKGQQSERKQVCHKNKEMMTDEGQAKQIKEKRAKTMNKGKQIENGLVDPSTSFESCLNYDLKAPKRKKRSDENKKTLKKCKTFENGETPHTTESIKELHKVVEDFHPSKTGSVVDLLNIPLPKYLPTFDEPSSFHYFESKTEKVAEVSDLSEEAPIFTGQRLNTKMLVYSGAKTPFLPAMMTLYQQCIRALQKNIDVLYEFGGARFEIIEPVLKGCKPDQLLLIEESNPVYIGLTDHLWEKHCRKDFRDHQLEAYECWREMHHRLNKERERKFKTLTKSIVTAHSKKSKARQVKLVFLNNKPHRHAQIQQEIHGTIGAMLQPHTLDRPSVKPQNNRAKPSYSAPGKAITSSGTSQVQDLCKKGRMAPMMAKSLKVFQKQFRHKPFRKMP